MEAVVDFLLEYYVWVLVVLVILLITIIGFLVDSKQKRKKKELQQTSSLEEVKTATEAELIVSEDLKPMKN